MPTLIAIVIAIVVFIWWARRLGGSGVPVAQRKKKSCDWQRVNPEETRALKEYRCAACNEVAYGRGENLPATRSCRAG